MRVGVFFQEFEPYHLLKDPGQIVIGLNEINVEAELVALEKPSLVAYSELPLRLIQPEQARDIAFWRSSGYDMVLAYTWIRSNFLWIPQVLSQAGLPVIVKGDTDGRLNYPLYPMWDTYVESLPKGLPYLKIARRRIKRRLNAQQSFAALSMHLEVASAAVVETPQAFANIAYLLAAYGASHLLGKISVIPNPVVPSGLAMASKVKQVVAVGDWEMKFGDYYAKNSKTMCSAIGRFLAARPDFNAILVGRGDALLNSFLTGLPMATANRIQITGELTHSKVLRTLNESQILFMPSISEGLSIAASEALTCGCSIVGSPLESLQYLSQGDKYGTLAANFGEDAYVGALVADAVRWDRGDYNPEAIATYWSKELCRKQIAGKFRHLFHRVQGTKND
jgi:glycosyltransferase involved in cell wall biosynthesis